MTGLAATTVLVDNWGWHSVEEYEQRRAALEPPTGASTDHTPPTGTTGGPLSPSPTAST